MITLWLHPRYIQVRVNPSDVSKSPRQLDWPKQSSERSFCTQVAYHCSVEKWQLFIRRCPRWNVNLFISFERIPGSSCIQVACHSSVEKELTTLLRTCPYWNDYSNHSIQKVQNLFLACQKPTTPPLYQLTHVMGDFDILKHKEQLP